ncbi:MAG: NAD(P)H-dependent oxidoreductase [Alphaproteobacteria bacterium]|nr:NAD(P)H-dependent oxidoreductase [Alphaproteobacteria bacterium]
MRCLVVYAHPVDTSFCAALRATAIDALQSAGHEVRQIDLYAEQFDPVMSRAERLAYHLPGTNEGPVHEHVRDIRWAQALVFVYPTWWYGLPAILKGWLDRVWLPHVTFTLPSDGSAIRGLMDNIEFLVVVTTAGASWFWLTLMGNPGRTTIMRGVRALCRRRCRKLWLAHYSMDRSTAGSRGAFLARIRKRLGAL